MPVNALEQVGIAVAVPLTWEDFRSRAATSHWLAKYFDRDLGAHDLEQYLRDRWDDEYLPLVADPVHEVLDLASNSGAAVHRDATLEDIRSITEDKQIAIVFAHWKGPEVVFEDLMWHDGALPYLTRLADKHDDFSIWLRSRLDLAGSDTSKLAQVLEDSLNYNAQGSTSAEGAHILQHCTSSHATVREQLNRTFKGLLRPGNRLELYDGLHTKEELEQAIAPTFSGVLDLTICTSTIPADYIAARRHHAMRTVQFEYEIEFVWAAACMPGTLKLFSTGNFDYQEARDTVVRIRLSEMERLLGGHDAKPKRYSQQCGG